MNIKIPKPLGRILERILENKVKSNSNLLNIDKPSLLYFKAKACIGCEEIEMFIGKIAKSSNRHLIIIDADNNGLPKEIYGEQLILDEDGKIRESYGVKVFPTLICVNSLGKIESISIGSNEKNKILKKLNLST